MRIDNSHGRDAPLNLAHRLASDIRRDIVAGVFAPGDRLKNDELAERYKVSVSPVREALWALQGEGFVVLLPHQGARVRAVDDDFVRNIFEIRALIEPMYVGRFCQRATRADLVRLRDAAEKFEESGAAGDAFAREAWNATFHNIMIDGDVNTEGMLVLDRHADLMSTLRQPEDFPEARQKMRVREHAGILAAVEQNDPDVAMRLAAEHVRAAGVDLLDDLSRVRARKARPLRHP